MTLKSISKTIINILGINTELSFTDIISKQTITRLRYVNINSVVPYDDEINTLKKHNISGDFREKFLSRRKTSLLFVFWINISTILLSILFNILIAVYDVSNNTNNIDSLNSLNIINFTMNIINLIKIFLVYFAYVYWTNYKKSRQYILSALIIHVSLPMVFMCIPYISIIDDTVLSLSSKYILNLFSNIIY